MATLVRRWRATTIPSEGLFGGAHLALAVLPFLPVVLDRLDEAGSGDPLFVFFPVQGGR